MEDHDGQFREIFDGLPIGILFYDEKGELIDANQSALVIKGIPSSDVFFGINLFDNPYVASRKEELLKKGLIKFQTSLDDTNKIDIKTKSMAVFIDCTVSVTDSGFLMQIQDITEHKKAEDTLHESEEKFHTIFQSSPFCVSLTRMHDGVIVDVNKQFTKMFGFTKEEAVGKTTIELGIARDLDKREQIFEKLPQQKYTCNIITTVFTKSGEPIITANNVGIIEIGSVKYLLVLSEDITGHVKTEKALKNSEARFRSLYENSFDAILLTKPDGSILAANPAAQKMFDMSEDEIIRAGRGGIVVDAQVGRFVKERAEKGKVQIELTHKRKDGSTFPAEVTSSLFKGADGTIKASTIIRDITKRKKLEEELRQARDYLEEQVQERTNELNIIIDSIADGVVIYDRNGDIVQINDIARKYYENICLDSKDHLMERVEKYRWFYSDGTPVTADNVPISRALHGEVVKNVDLYLDGSSGFKWLTASAVPLYDKTSSLFGGVLTFNDITDRKTAEKQLKEVINELKRSNDELQQFAYISSHDLQEPLRTIASFTRLLERRYKGKLDSDADEFMDYIVEAAVRMKEQIGALLEYSRVATKEKEFKLVNTNEIVNQTINSSYVSIKESNTEIIVDKLPNVMGDAGQLGRVFQNLISNAIRFRKCEEPLKIHISAYKSEDMKEYVFSVQDNGIGIEEQYFDRIFTIFQRLHTIEEYHGTGIGLSIVKRIIERHGGRIWVESEFGVGSTFYFTVPMNE